MEGIKNIIGEENFEKLLKEFKAEKGLEEYDRLTTEQRILFYNKIRKLYAFQITVHK